MDWQESRELFQSLLQARGLQQPDERALHRYRFTRAEHAAVVTFLRTKGPTMARDRHGAALAVAHVAEWYRRDRIGGHWDWIRPLADIGWRYGQDWNAPLRYGDVAEMVDRGFAVWRRPKPASGNRLFAVVRESGFPAAAVRDDPRIASWLRKSVLAVERGFAAADAVSSESWRVADSVAAALHEPAEELVEAVVELRRVLPDGAVSGVDDPISILNRQQPDWRDRLPFDVEIEDVRSMVETIIRVKADRSAALAVARRLMSTKTGWSPSVEVGISGTLDLRRLPRGAANAIAGLDRVRVLLRSPPGDGRAIAAIERLQDEDDEVAYELRPFVSRCAAFLPLDQEVRLSILAGDLSVAELVPFGGEGQDAPVLAFEIEELDAEGRPQSLRLLGASSVRTAKPHLALAVEQTSLASLSFSGEHQELGRCGTRHIIIFSGAATHSDEGTRTSWRTGAESEQTGRIVLVGDALRGIREHVFQGLPEVWIEEEGRSFIARQQRLLWRTVGRGAWQALNEGQPYGRIHIAYAHDGEIIHQANAAVAPATLTFRTDRIGRRLNLSGTAGASVGAVGSGPLPVSSTSETASIDLRNLPAGGTVHIALCWHSEVNLSLTDPLLERALLAPSGRALPRRTTLALDELHGYRLVSAAGERLCLELHASDTTTICLVRPIDGEVPLTVLADDAARLIGGSDDIDAEVRLSWLGSNEHAASIRWYAEAADPFTTPRSTAFGVLARLVGLELSAFSLLRPTAGVATGLTRESPDVMASRLGAELGDGPWLLYGRRSGGGTIRPSVLEPVGIRSDATSPLACAICNQNAAARRASMDAQFCDPMQLPHDDRRMLIDLVVVARRAEVPYCALDALDALARAPAAAVMALIFCETLEERSAVLELQRELPFLWCATCMSDWHVAVEARLLFLRDRLVAAQLPSDMAERSLASALGEILSLRPELAMHVATVALCHLTTSIATAGDAAAQRIFKAAAVPIDVEGLIARLVEQHGEVSPPHGLFPNDVLNVVRAAWESYNPAFAHILAAPRIAAEYAAGIHNFPPVIIRRCRDAWAYDPYFFERAVPHELQRMSGVESTPMSENR